MNKRTMLVIIGLVCPVVLLAVLFYYDSTKVKRISVADRNCYEIIHANATLDKVYVKAEPEVDGDMVMWEYPEFVEINGQEYRVSTNDASVDYLFKNVPLEQGESVYLNRLYADKLLLSRKPLNSSQVHRYNETFYAESGSGLASATVAILLLWLIMGVMVVFRT